VGDVHRRAESVGRRADARADDHTGHLADGSGLREHRKRSLLDLPFVMLEEDERLRHQTSLFSARNSTIVSAALPSSSIRRDSPRGGGGLSPTTVVPGAPASDTPTVSCGFFFAPMIPFSDG